MNNVEDVKKYISSFGFDIDLEIDIYKEAIKHFLEKQDLNGLIHYISQLQNCGGYALEIPVCIWPVQDYTFEEKVLRILELYPFVRLLSTGEIKDNEYVVLYRAAGGGHHFIKVKDNKEIVEKNGSNLPQKFDGWDNLKDSPEAVFAVVKQEDRDENVKKLPQCNRNINLDTDAYEYIEKDGYKDICLKPARSSSYI